jgi:hypothetical protein
MGVGVAAAGAVVVAGGVAEADVASVVRVADAVVVGPAPPKFSWMQ